ANIVLVQGIKAGKDGGIRYLPPIIVSEDNGKYTNVIEELLYGKGK
ncbi:SAM-dependent methyltransferase, partial [Lactobacillus salivarius]|nr:SAM-dependent methyltransferase [Ligilactobacillus salivarius]